MKIEMSEDDKDKVLDRKMIDDKILQLNKDLAKSKN